MKSRGRKANGQLGCPKDRACAYCHLHRCLMSVRQMKNRECLRKSCRHLVPHKQHDFWRQREEKKEKKKARKEAMTNDLHPVQASADRL